MTTRSISAQLSAKSFKIICKFTDMQNALAEHWTSYVTGGREESVRMGIGDLRQDLDQLEEILGPLPSDDEEDFGPTLLIEPGDCEFHGRCQRCGKHLGTVRPDQSLDILGEAWDRHANWPGEKCS